MSRVPPLENYRSSGSGQSNNADDGIQKEALQEMMMHMMHHELKPTIKSLVNSMVKEELRNLLPGLARNSDNQVNTCEPSCLKLQFLNNVSLPILTNEEIKGDGDTSIEVALIDNLNDKVVDSGPEASSKVEIVALMGDIGGAEGDNWTSEEFNRKIVREREGVYSKGNKKRKREGKKPLLDGDVHLRLNRGIGVVGKIKFRHYTQWMKNSEFKLGARVLNSFNGVRIKEAMTKSFIVKDRRITYERKHGPPSSSDDVSKLKNIRRGGNHHKSLQEQKINTVQDFLIQLFKDPERLKHILGLEANLWEVTVNHARKCAIEKRICYYFSSQQKIGVAFNVCEQADARILAITACDHWQDVLCFRDKNSLLQYVGNLSTTEECSNPPKQQVPCGHNTSYTGISSPVDSSTHGNNAEDIVMASVGNVEISEEPHLNISGDDSMDSFDEFAENFFRRLSQLEKAQKSWKKLSVVVRISMKKWQL